MHTAPVPTGLCRATTFSCAFWQRAWYHARTSRPQIWRPSSISFVSWQWRGCSCCDNRTAIIMREAGGTTGSNASGQAGAHGPDPRSAAVTFVTTEHFTLQGARAATTAESTGRAAMFLGSVSAGLVALGLIATATRIGTAFYAFGLIVLSTLSFVGFVTFQRVLQSGIEDHGYAERIARLRAYYFDCAPELVPYLASVPPPQRLVIQGLRAGYWQAFRTVAGMVGVVTAVLAGSAAGLLTAIADGHSGVAGFVAGGIVGVAILVALMESQFRRFRSLFGAEQSGPGTD